MNRRIGLILALVMVVVGGWVGQSHAWYRPYGYGHRPYGYGYRPYGCRSCPASRRPHGALVVSLSARGGRTLPAGGGRAAAASRASPTASPLLVLLRESAGLLPLRPAVPRRVEAGGAHTASCAPRPIRGARHGDDLGEVLLPVPGVLGACAMAF
jgi:hypothetical protein